MKSSFNKSGKYFAQLTSDGKLKLWNALSNSLEQEYVPDYHLAAPCTCLKFFDPDDNTRRLDGSLLVKRKKKISLSSPSILLGTTSGLLLIFSIAEGKLDYSINSDTGEQINCLSYTDDNSVYSGGDFQIVQFNLQRRSVYTKWKAGNEKISSILVTADRRLLLSASKTIKVWNIKTKEVVRTFTGHKSEIIYLDFVTQGYFVSGSRNDRLLSCWNLSDNVSERDPVANYLLSDTFINCAVNVTSPGNINLAVTVRSGVVHIFQHTLNGKLSKPVKPKTSIQIVSENSDSEVKQSVSPIHIAGSIYQEENVLCIGHGSEIILTFENITFNFLEKVQCIIRRNPSQVAAAVNVDSAKLKKPVIDNQVNYLTPYAYSSGLKRKCANKVTTCEVPLEERLLNLKLNESEKFKVNNVAQLLVQGLHSNDEAILKTALRKQEESIIKSTLLRLPLPIIPALLTKLSSLLHGKTQLSQVSVLWLKCLLQTHASLLMSNPNLIDHLKPILASLSNRLKLQTPLTNLKERLELKVVDNKLKSYSGNTDQALLTFTDKN